jgi:hypothetical protein
MAATNPNPQPESDDRRDRPHLASAPTTTPARRPRGMWIVIAAAVIVAAVILYFVLYSGGGSGGGGTSGGDGGGYFMLAFGADQARRLVSRLKR